MVCILVAVFALVFATYTIIRNPLFQKVTARLASGYLSEKLHTTVRIAGFNLSPIRGLVLEGVLVKDLHQGNLIAARKISVVPGKISLSKKFIRIRKVYIDQGEFQLITYKGDSVLNLQFIIDYFSSPEKQPKPPDTTKTPGWNLGVSMAELIDFHFHFQDQNKPAVDTGMDYANIDVRNINLLMTDFRPDGDTMKAKILHLSAVERSGFRILAMKGEYQVGPAFLKAHNMKLSTDHCNLDLSFDFLYNSWNAYTDFLNKVHIVANIHPSWFDLQDIGAFAPVLYKMKNRFRIGGRIDGTVSKFRAENFNVAFGKKSMLLCNLHSNGLPDVMNTFVDMNIHMLETNREDIAGIKLPIEGTTLPIPKILDNVGTMKLAGYYTGFWNDFVAELKIKTGIGDATTNLVLKKDKETNTMLYNGEVDVSGFNIRQLTETKFLTGPVSFRADLRGKGFDINTADILMNIWIDSIGLRYYTYQHLHVKGMLSDKKFDGQLEISDPNLGLNFNGIVDLSDSVPNLNFTTNIDHADLYTLNLLKRNPKTSLSTHLDVNIKAKDIENIDGRIQIADLVYSEGDKTMSMDDFLLTTSRDPGGKKTYHLTSDYMDADFKGTFRFRDIIPSLEVFVNNYLVNFHLSDSLRTYKSGINQVFTYRIFIKETKEVTDIFVPYLEIADGSFIEGFYNEDKGLIKLNGYSPEIAVMGMKLEDWFMHITSRTDNLNIVTGANQFVMKEKNENDSLIIFIDSLNMVSDLRNDSILCRIGFLNGPDHSTIGGSLAFGKSPAMKLRFDKLHVRIDKNFWDIDTSNLVTFDSTTVSFRNFNLSSGIHNIKVNGTISKNPADTLTSIFDNVDISNLDRFLGDTTINIDGILSGKLKISNLYEKLTLLSDLRIKDFRFNRVPLGDATIDVGYNDATKKFDLKSEIIYTGNIGTNIPFSLEGSFSTAEKEQSLDFKLKLQNLNMKMVNPFVSGFMGGINGFASGDFRITGTFEKPVIAGELKLMRAELKINYLNVLYSLADVVTVDTNTINFNNITVYDSLGHKASLNGKITHHYFKNFNLDLNFDFTDFSAFKSTYAQNSIFYGNARASGTVRIAGPPDKLSITVKAKTGGGTHVIIPINTTADISQNEYIIFETPVVDTLKTKKGSAAVPSGGLTLNMSLLVNPSAEIEVYFPDQLGNIKASGTGNITMGLTPTSDFTMTGTYTVSKGSFLFALRNLLRLNMSIREGSTISWSGDPTDATISMSAVYKTRVPLAGLTADESKASTRVPVECIIRLNGNLMNPEISFGLEMPNVEEDVKTLVYSAIDTTNTSEMNQQMIYILVMNQFKPVTGSAFDQFNVSGTSLTLLTNQLSSWLSSVSKNVNVGVNYKPGSTTTGQEFDVALSTQLFNDRLLIDGLFGMSQNNPQTVEKVNTIVGDINIEYILTKNRRYRLRVFNRTNTVDVLNNNSQYTQGVGVSYQRDFTNWGELFKSNKKRIEGKKSQKKAQ